MPYALALAAVLLMVAARALLTPVLGYELPFITLFPAVFVAAWLGGLGPAVVAATAGAGAALYLFFLMRSRFPTPPRLPTWAPQSLWLPVLLSAGSVRPGFERRHGQRRQRGMRARVRRDTGH